MKIENSAGVSRSLHKMLEFRLAKAADAVTTILARRFRAHGVSLSEWQLLAVIGRQPWGRTPSQTARIAGMDHVTVLRILDELIRRNWVQDRPDHEREGGRLLALTPGGLAVLRILLPIALDLEYRLFGDVSPVGIRAANELWWHAGAMDNDFAGKANVEVRIGDALRLLRSLPKGSVDCCVTSPPYYRIRDYGHPDQLGLEPTVTQYVDKLAAIFDEVRRVLKSTGTCWITIGDNYCTRRAIREDGMRTVAKGGKPRSYAASAALGLVVRPDAHRNEGIKEGDLFLAPESLLSELCKRDWEWIDTAIWEKPTVTPRRAPTNRPVNAYERVLIMSKSDRWRLRTQHLPSEWLDLHWVIAPSRARTVHTATMPAELAARCILLGSDPGDLVLDPFGGAGTTGLVARRYGRRSLSIEINPHYAELARERIKRG